MNLTVILPFDILLKSTPIYRLNVETPCGWVGILPGRRDCVLELAPGILTYQTIDNTDHYIAIDEGLLIKKTPDVTVVTRQGFMSDDLEYLQQQMRESVLQHNEQEQQLQGVLTTLEHRLLQGLRKQSW